MEQVFYRSINLSELDRSRALQWSGVALTLLATGLVVALIPAEKQLGGSLRYVILHGAWVWSGLIVFSLAALTGLIGLVSGKPSWHVWSQILGRLGLVYWVTYLLMSLAIMQMSWGGFYFSEPRWRIPFTFAVVALLLQCGLAILSRPALTSLANLLFAPALLVSLNASDRVLHPDSPVFGSGSVRIQVFFILILILLLAAGFQAALLWRKSTWGGVKHENNV